MKKLLLLATVAGLPLIATAAAAQVTPATYQGVYIGGSLGLDVIEDDASETIVFDTDLDGEFGDTVFTSAPADAFSPGFCSGEARDTGPEAGCDGDGDGLGYALRIGIDGRPGGGSFVAGLLLEGAMSNAKDYTTAFSTTPASYTTIRSLDYAISARGRLGWSPGSGRGLLYATGGISYAKIDHDFVTTNTANSFEVVDGDDMVFGFQGGAGAEVLITPNFGIGLEYLFSKYDDDESYVAVGPGTAGPTNPFLLDDPEGTNLRQTNDDFDLHSFRVTGSYRF